MPTYISADKSVINRITGLNIWFGDIDNIIFRVSIYDGKYGIIDRNLNIKVPAKYNEIKKIGGQTIEKCLNTNDLNTSKLKFKYEGQTKKENFFIARKCNNNFVNENKMPERCNIYGVIGSNDEIIIPFENYSFKEYRTGKELDEIAQKAITQENAQAGRSNGIFIVVIIIAFFKHLFGLL